MKAEEVQRRYAAGERDFSGANLRGQNFKGQTLSGADFSHADIRGANFTTANLSGADFTGAKAGLRRRSIVFQTALAFILSVLLNSASISISERRLIFFSEFEVEPSYTFLPGLVVMIVIAVAFLAIVRQWYTTQAVGTIAIAVASAGVNIDMVAFAFAFAFAGAVAGAASATVAVAFAVAFAVVLVNKLEFLLQAVSLTARGVFTPEFVVAVIATFANVLLSLYVARRAIQGDEKFAIIRIIGVALSTIGGTTFYKADLTDANFTKATLKSTHLHTANLTRVCWKDAQKLDRARVGDSILADAKVRSLLVSRNGYKQSLVDANLAGANLDGVNLNEANLKGANLQNASLRETDLRGANLTGVQAIETNFMGAFLTGACLEAWNIDHTTTLENIDCQFAFLLEKANERGDRERRPHDPKQVFQPGDFEKLYREVINTVQILLRNGLNREAFAEAFQQLMTEHGTISFDSIQAIEKKGDDVLLTIEVPEAADKAKIAQDFLKPYEDRVKQLEAQVDRLTLHSTDIKEIALAIAQRPITIHNQAIGRDMQENDSSRKIEIGSIGRDFNASGQALNLGDISGTVTNAINQLPSSAEGDRLKDLLIELQAAIETDPQLPDDDKQTALEQVKELASAGQESDVEKKRSIGKRATQMLKGIAASLPDATSLVEACAKLLPLITPMIGL